jgi:DNA topoisomerase-1
MIDYQISSLLLWALQVLASYGHIRDLPKKSGSVLPDEDFSMLWETLVTAKPRIKEITDAAKAADVLVLATDPDREGEAIAWHLCEELRVCGS